MGAHLALALHAAPHQASPLPRLFPLVCIGYFGNNVFPFRAGEFIRSYVLKRKEEVSFMSSITTVLIERVFDGLTMLLFVFLALPFAPAMPDFYRRVVIVLTVLLLATTVFVWMAVQPPRGAAFYGFFAGLLCPVSSPPGGFLPALHGGAPEPEQRHRCPDDLRDQHRHLAVGDRQVLVRDASVRLPSQLPGADAHERSGQPGHHATLRTRLHRHL